MGTRSHLQELHRLPKVKTLNRIFDRIETCQRPVEELEKDNNPPGQINSCEQRLIGSVAGESVKFIGISGMHVVAILIFEA